MSEWLGGLAPASPTPTPMRAASSIRKFWAMPQSAVMPLQMIIAIERIFTRLQRSASAAMGMPRVV